MTTTVSRAPGVIVAMPVKLPNAGRSAVRSPSTKHGRRADSRASPLIHTPGCTWPHSANPLVGVHGR